MLLLRLFFSHFTGHFMTQRQARLRGRDLIERWCALAERRLDYLTELFESGRWRRFHTEADFLENIREAKLAVERWRLLSTQEASLDNRAVNWSWLDRAAGVPLYRGSVLHEESQEDVPDAASRPADGESFAPSPALRRAMAAMAPVEEPVSVAAQVADHLQSARDPLVLLDRYPILRTAI